jgi:hypothetical protein
MKRPAYEVDYIARYYKHESMSEPPCVLGYLRVFVLSNGDVLTVCYPLAPVRQHSEGSPPGDCGVGSIHPPE